MGYGFAVVLRPTGFRTGKVDLSGMQCLAEGEVDSVVLGLDEMFVKSVIEGVNRGDGAETVVVEVGVLGFVVLADKDLIVYNFRL